MAADRREMEVRKAFDAFQDSWRKYDAASADRIVSDDFLLITQGGSIRGKNHWLQALKDRQVGTPGAIEGMTIRLYGDTAVVNYTDNGTSPAGATTKKVRTLLLVKTNGSEWKVVLRHATSVTP
jgi:ketosteroid isomerase-like protein